MPSEHPCSVTQIGAERTGRKQPPWAIATVNSSCPIFTKLSFTSLVWGWVLELLQCRKPRFDSWVGKIPWGRSRLPTPVFLSFPAGSFGEESTCNVGDLGLIPGLGRSTGEENGYPLQNSGLENSMYSPWVKKNWTGLSNFHFHFIEFWAWVSLSI